MCPEPTEFLLIGYLTELTWKVRFRSSALTPPDCRRIDKRKLLMWRMEQSSLIFQHQPFQRPLLCQENFSLVGCTKRMAKRMQEQMEENRIVAKSRPIGDEPDQFCSCKFFICEQSDCVDKPRDTQSFKSTGWIIRETWCKRKSNFQSRRSVEFSRMAKGCSTVPKDRETCSNGQRSGASESSREICHQHKRTCSSWIPKMFRKSWIWPHHFRISPH